MRFRVESDDHTLQNHLDTAGKNAVYTSSKIQNEIISVIGCWILRKLLQDIQTGSKVFSIIADESRDCSNKEQMPLIVCFVDEIKETFMGFVESPEHTLLH